MFLHRLLERNRPFVDAAVHLHQEGRVRAGTYLIDLDTLAANAAAIKQTADREGLAVYFMAKQFGRNPDACRTIAAAGMPKAVAVDLQGMEAVLRAGAELGHVGHLVQPHRTAADAVVRALPEVVTVFSHEAAERLGAAAVKSARVQDVLLRVVAPGDTFYFGHGGGFPLDRIESAASRVDAIRGLSVVGATTFPCLLADPETRTIEPTPNLATLAEAAGRLRAGGFEVRQVNAPGTTSAQTMAMLREHGATHVEPGNAFHGTTPIHVFDPDAPESPAIVLVSEVSHLHEGDAYVFANGLYVDRVLGRYGMSAVCGRDSGSLERYEVATAEDGAIHYYCTLRLPAGHDVRVGDTVVFCFRPQTFVTRARTQAVAGAATAKPTLGHVYDQEARAVEGVS